MNILRMKKLAGFDVPSFYEYARGADVKVNETPVELTEAQWVAFDLDYKGTYKDGRHILVIESGALQLIPVKTTFIGGVDNTAKEEKVPDPKETVKDETKAVGGDPEKAAEDRIAAVGEPDKNAATPEPKSELGAEKPKEEDLQDEKVTSDKGGEAVTGVKEAAEEKAKKLIAAVNALKRVTNTSATQVDSNTASDKPKSELGAEKPKECDLQDDQAANPKKVSEKWDTDYKTPESKKGMFDGKSKEDLESELAALKKSGPHKEGSAEFTKEKELQFALRAKNDFGKVKESAEDIAKRIIASVKAGNHPHDAQNDGEAKEEKGESTDYNKEVVDGDVVDNAKKNDEKETKVVADKTGEEQRKEEKVEVPAKVMSQIDARLSELKAAKEEYDNKGYNDQSVKQNAIEFLEKVKEHLALRDVEGLNQAQVLFGTLMSPITDLLPAALVNFLGTARNSEETTGTKAEV